MKSNVIQSEDRCNWYYKVFVMHKLQYYCNRRPLDPPTASPKLPKSLDADTSNCRGWLTGENAIGVGPGQVQ